MAADNNRLRWTVAAALSAAALALLGAAVYNWVIGGGTWYLFGVIKIRLHQWEKPWLSGIGLFALAVAVRPGGFIPAAVFRAVFDPWRFRGPSFARPWAVFGAAAGFGVGMYFSRCWHYLFPTFLHTLPFITAWAVALAGLMAGAAVATEKLLARHDDRRRQGLMQGGLVLVILGLVYWPLSRWEGVYADPAGPLFYGFGLALVHIWFIGFLQRYEVLAGKRKKIILAGVALGLCTAMAVSHLRYRGRLSGPAPRDRVIFVTLDTTRPDHLSAYGYHRGTSPSFDALAGNGARFAFAVCPQDTTDPSHASMFTGYYPRTHGALAVGYPITAKVNSLPQYFSDRGFATAAVLSRRLFIPSTLLNLPGFTDEFSLRGSAKDSSAPTAFRRAANWLDGHRNEDIFLWVHFFDPHLPYEPHPNFPVRYTSVDKECDAENHRKKSGWTTDEIRDCIDLYDGEIAYMDFWLGRLLDYVDQMEPKSERPPLIVLVSDHGEVLGEHINKPNHYSFGHGPVVYSQTAWVPLVISWPGRIKPGLLGGTAELVDLAPTLVDLIFDRDDFASQGQSMRPALEGSAALAGIGIIQQSMVPPELHRFNTEPTFAVFRGPEKLSVFGNGAVGYTDLRADPLEALDLAPLYPGPTSELEGKFREWESRVPLNRPKPFQLTPRERTAIRALGYIQ